MLDYNNSSIANYLRQAALARGMDPDVVVRVWKSEGGSAKNWQSNVYNKKGIREPSYGPLQMLRGGPGTGYRTGLGNAFEDRTGLNVTSKSNWPQMVDFALDHAAQNGWSEWYGPKHAGIGRWEGIKKGMAGSRPAPVLSASAVPSPGLGAGTPLPASASAAPPSPQTAQNPNLVKGLMSKLMERDSGTGQSGFQGLMGALSGMFGGGESAPPAPDASQMGPSYQDDMAQVMQQNTLPQSVNSKVSSPFEGQQGGGDMMQQQQAPPPPDQMAEMTPDQMYYLRKMGLI